MKTSLSRTLVLVTYPNIFMGNKLKSMSLYGDLIFWGSKVFAIERLYCMPLTRPHIGEASEYKVCSVPKYLDKRSDYDICLHAGPHAR